MGGSKRRPSKKPDIPRQRFSVNIEEITKLTAEPDEFIRQQIKRAEGGDVEASREILSEFVWESEIESLNPLILRYVGERISRYLEDGTPLEGRSVSKLGPPYKAEHLCIVANYILRKEYLGRKVGVAMAETAKYFDCSSRLVENVRKEFRAFVKNMSNPKEGDEDEKEKRRANIDLLIRLALPIDEQLDQELNEL